MKLKEDYMRRGYYTLKTRSIKGKSIKAKYKTRSEKIAEKLNKMQKSGQYVGSKWNKTNVLLNNRYTSRFIPKTRKLNQLVLNGMLNEFKMIYLKPINGTYGKGVIRVEKHQENGRVMYHYQQGIEKKQFLTLPALYQTIMKKKMKRSYIAQQGIHLLKYKKSLFDLRIMVQRNLKGIWETTGIIGRVAHPKKIVTNYHSGGTPMSFKTIFKSYLSDIQINEYHQILNKFGIDVAVTMSKKYPMLNMLGIDVGVDKELFPWIIEVNTNPDLYIFKKLKNKAIFHKMYQYAKHLKRA
jgi:glutathione synthase/RimK-type ligase-like ATP-grasp enzyme